jgi:hypothetical protein
MMAHAYNPSYWEVELEKIAVQGQLLAKATPYPKIDQEKRIRVWLKKWGTLLEVVHLLANTKPYVQTTGPPPQKKKNAFRVCV